jgi:hypothetical protein
VLAAVLSFADFAARRAAIDLALVPPAFDAFAKFQRVLRNAALFESELCLPVGERIGLGFGVDVLAAGLSSRHRRVSRHRLFRRQTELILWRTACNRREEVLVATLQMQPDEHHVAAPFRCSDNINNQRAVIYVHFSNSEHWQWRDADPLWNETMQRSNFA